MTRFLLAAALAAALGGCASVPRFEAGQPCVTPAMTVSDRFPAANRGVCEVLGDDHVRLTLTPEDPPPINDSPWYAFKVQSRGARRVTVTLRYEGGHHRYLPKYSYDNAYWHRLDPQAVTVSADGRQARFELPLDERPVFVAAQEIVPAAVYDAWLARVARESQATREVLGHSVAGRRIDYLDTGGDGRDVLLIVGRQHPPEVSGGLAFLSFAESVLGPTDLARRFRAHFRVVAIPLLNPDGVNAGHWRHNLGGVDLNRDWGPFTQPETQGVRDLLARLDAGGNRVRLFLDMHSTRHNVFYTQDDGYPTDPPRFMRRWLADAGERIDRYAFVNDPRPVSEQANSKNYLYKRYGIPTATYEVGDETDRPALRQAAADFAETLMSRMLAEMATVTAGDLPPGPVDDAGLREGLARYVSGWLANDPDAVMAAFVPEPVLMPAGGETIQGHAAARAYWWPEGSPPFEVRAFDLYAQETGGAGDLGYVRGRFRLTWTSEGATVTTRGKHLTLLRRQGDGRWLITHHSWDALPADDGGNEAAAQDSE